MVLHFLFRFGSRRTGGFGVGDRMLLEKRGQVGQGSVLLLDLEMMS